MAFVYAYDKRTGEKLAHQVPEHWLDHPTLGANLSRTPRQKAAERKAATRGDTTNTPATGDEKE
jgi:hypothetical protein